jgi:diguanylate cyclase (GGDEF)-like protein/PAS domain S-box-containing protein
VPVPTLSSCRSSSPSLRSSQGSLHLLGLFAAALLAAVLTGLVTYHRQRNALERQAKAELSYLAQAQRDQLDRWLSERLKDAEVTAEDPLISARLPARARGRQVLQDRIQTIQEAYGYDAIQVLDTAARPLAATDLDPVTSEERRAALGLVCGAPPQLVWSLDGPDQDAVVKVSCLVPLGAGRKPHGILVFRLDIEAMLVSILHNQPTFRPSGETLLVCRQGGRMIFLGQARLAPPHPVSRTAKAPVPAQDVLAREGFSQGEDYRGVPSIAASRQLTNLPWTVLSKMDEAEIAAPLARLARIYAAASALFLAILGVLLRTWWSKNLARHQANQANLQREKDLLDRQLKALSRYANDIVLLFNGAGQVLDANDRALDAYGYARDEMLRLKAPQLWVAGALESFLKGFQIEGHPESIRSEAVQVRKDGSTFPVELSSREFKEQGATYFQVIIRDITERKRAEDEVLALQDQLREQATRDSLTGLYNRRFLDDAMERELFIAERSGHPISVIMGDLDHFKIINDTHGHLAGDAVLRAFSALVQHLSRRSDISCRYGGEEFLLVLPGLTKELARERADQLRRRLEALPVAFGDQLIGVTASFGVAAFPQDGVSREALIAAADHALYAAKESGRNRVSTWEGARPGI